MSWVVFRSMSSSSSLRLPEPPVIEIGAQFIYISRFPTLLNQVQATTPVPVGKDEGIVNGYVSGITAVALLPVLPVTPFWGHPPSIEWITFHTLSFVGFRSYVTDTWHEPPPWTAVPMNARLWVDPIGQLLLAPSALYTAGRCLQGKSEPSALRGKLSSVDLPKGTGEVISTWQLTSAASPRTESRVEVYMMISREYSFLTK